MGVDTQGFVRQHTAKLVVKYSISRGNKSVRIHDVHYIHWASGNSLEGFLQVTLFHMGESHDVQRRLVPFVMEGLYKGERLVDILDITSHADQIEQAVFPRQDIRFIYPSDVDKSG